MWLFELVRKVKEMSENNNLSSWIRKQYENVKKLLSVDEFKLLVLVAQYEGVTPIQFIISRIQTDLSYYRKNLRFNRWREKYVKK